MVVLLLLLLLLSFAVVGSMLHLVPFHADNVGAMLTLRCGWLQIYAGIF